MNSKTAVLHEQIEQLALLPTNDKEWEAKFHYYEMSETIRKRAYGLRASE